MDHLIAIKIQKLKIYVLLLINTLLLSVLSLEVYSQQTVPVSGGSLIGIGGNVVFTVGQMNYGSITDKNNVSVVKGIQQPVETDQKTNVDPSFNLAIKCTVSPNPTSDFIFIKIDDSKFKEYSFELIDVNGKTIFSNPIIDNITQIDLRELISANYLIKITHQNKLITSFKIFKN